VVGTGRMAGEPLVGLAHVEKVCVVGDLGGVDRRDCHTWQLRGG
jgi:hypothetical protein